MLQLYLVGKNIDQHNTDAKYWFDIYEKIKDIVGNYHTDLSFLSCQLAKSFLMARHNIPDYEITIQSQTKSGLDIDIVSYEGERIIAEIKNTCAVKSNDLGAQQKISFYSDWEKLNKSKAHFKYFFLTDNKTYQVVQSKYKKQCLGFCVILL